MSKGHTLQDPYLNILRKERVPVSIYLGNHLTIFFPVDQRKCFIKCHPIKC